YEQLGMRSFGMVLLAAACGGLSKEDAARLVPKNPKQQSLAERLKEHVLSLISNRDTAEQPLKVTLPLHGEVRQAEDSSSGALVAKTIAAYSQGSGWLIRVGEYLLQLQEQVKSEGKAFWEWFSGQSFPFSPRAGAYYMSAARGAAALG